MRLLPPSNVPARIVAISVRGSVSAKVTQRSARPASDIERLLNQYGVPATWAFDDPTAAKGFQRTHSGAGHELAACHDGAAKPDLLTTLRRFRQAGVAVSTLVSRSEPSADDFGRLVREGVSLVAVDDHAGATCERVVTLRFGLWRLSTSDAIAAPEGWLRGMWGAGRGRRMVDRTIRRNELLHLRVDEGALTNHSPAIRILERLLRHVDRRREQGLLQLATLNEIARQLERPRSAATAESILRVRAA